MNPFAAFPSQPITLEIVGESLSITPICGVLADEGEVSSAVLVMAGPCKRLAWPGNAPGA